MLHHELHAWKLFQISKIALRLQVKVDALEGALDRFARFFIEPLLTKAGFVVFVFVVAEDCTDREINAVDSEFQAGLTQPAWREIGILNMSANPLHPFHVACGNNKMLREDPKEKGRELSFLLIIEDINITNIYTIYIIYN